jgi:hypothetical protein
MAHNMVPNTNSSHQDTAAPSWRSFCPVESCQRACKSKTGWTAHLRSVHPHLDFSNLQSRQLIANLSHPSHVSLNVNCRDFASSPVRDDYAAASESGSNIEMEGTTFNPIRNDIPCPDLRSSQLRGSDFGDGNEYHPVINGKSLFSDINPVLKFLMDNLQVNHVTRMAIPFQI